MDGKEEVQSLAQVWSIFTNGLGQFLAEDP